MKAGKAVAALALAAVFACAAPMAGAQASAVRTDTQQSATDVQRRPGCPDRRGGHMRSMAELSKLTGLSVEQLTQKYPQKTAWQIARQMGRLDQLKAAVRASHKTAFDKMVKDGVITSADRDKMTADLDKRLSAIDGEKTVILGRPGYRPQFKKDPRGMTPQTSHEPSR